MTAIQSAAHQIQEDKSNGRASQGSGANPHYWLRIQRRQPLLHLIGKGGVDQSFDHNG